MAQVFRATPSAGAILPGNHDGLMFGIYGYDILDAAARPRCGEVEPAPAGAARRREDAEHRTANEALTKRDFIAGYLAGQAAGRRAKPGL